MTDRQITESELTYLLDTLTTDADAYTVSEIMDAVDMMAVRERQLLPRQRRTDA